MNTFIFIAGHREELPLIDLLTSAADRLVERMPWTGEALVKGHAEFPELKAGWIWIRPDSDQDNAFISEASDDRYAVITFGEVLGVPKLSAAQQLLKTFRRGGPHALRELEACFSAVIVDLVGRNATLIGDLLGQRSLRYFADGQLLIASPHDISIAATGLCPLDLDLVSACSIAIVGWSLEGKSLLRKIKTCHPSEYLKWRNDGKFERFEDFVIDPERRIDRKDTKAIKIQLQEMIDTARMHAKIASHQKPSINVTLSSGSDSRAVLALLKSVYDISKVTCVTAGGDQSLNVRVASRLASRYGASWRQIEHTSQPPKIGDFLRHTDVLAFSINGDGTVKDLATKSCSFPDKSEPMTWHGDGAPIFKGRYFFKPFIANSRISLDEVKQGLFPTAHLDRLRRILRPVGAIEGVIDRSERFMERHTNRILAPVDIYYLSYLHENSGVALSRKMRDPYTHKSYYPYYSRQLVRMAFRMPAPIAEHTPIHLILIRQALPKAEWVRINGDYLLPLLKKGVIAKALRKADRTYLSWEKKFRSMLSRRHKGKQFMDNEEMRAASLFGPLGDPVKELLAAEDSISSSLFGKEGVDALFDDRYLTRGWRTHLVGSLITMERWKKLMDAVSYNTQKIRSP